MLFILCCCFIFPNSIAAAFQDIEHLTGSASALYGSLQLFGGAVVGFVLAYVPESSAMPLSLSYISMGLLTFVTLHYCNNLKLKEA